MEVPRLGAALGRRGGGVVVRGGALIARPPRSLADGLLRADELLGGGGVPLPPLGLGGPPGGVLLSLLPSCVVAVFLAR